MIDWTSVKDKMPQGFTPLVMIVTYPTERFFREGHYNNGLWYTDSHSGGSFPIRHPDAVVTHWCYINFPELPKTSLEKELEEGIGEYLVKEPWER